MRIKTLGFPKMHKEKGERRDFLPELFQKLDKFKEVEIYLEEGYGEGMGFKHKDYLHKNPNLKFVSHDEIYKKDLVVVLRAPKPEDIEKMRKESSLISMLHYDTRPIRNALLKRKEILSFSMDSMVDDDNNRMVVNYWGTAMSGARIAFKELQRRMRDFYSLDRKIINITIMGFGKVGLNAARAFKELSNLELLSENVPGLVINMLTRSITKDKEALKYIFKETDLLVDATWRKDATKIIVPNSLIAHLPEHAIILDLAADPYNEKVKPIQVKGIEGIPTGTLDKYVIEPDDELYETIPKEIDKTNRRLVVSCNAWPGVHPEESMAVYGRQIFPFIKVLLENGSHSLDIDSENLYERALVRSSLDYFLKNYEYWRY